MGNFTPNFQLENSFIEIEEIKAKAIPFRLIKQDYGCVREY